MEINKSEAKELDYVELWIGTTITRQGGLVSGQELLSQSKVAWNPIPLYCDYYHPLTINRDLVQWRLNQRREESRTTVNKISNCPRDSHAWNEFKLLVLPALNYTPTTAQVRRSPIIYSRLPRRRRLVAQLRLRCSVALHDRNFFVVPRSSRKVGRQVSRMVVAN